MFYKSDQSTPILSIYYTIWCASTHIGAMLRHFKATDHLLSISLICVQSLPGLHDETGHTDSAACRGMRIWGTLRH